ncbi:MAG: hypothetical protein K0U78_12335 [Actinomycetia bacterium]|nr:hypothetical protein [Actinomycetes bacterium]
MSTWLAALVAVAAVVLVYVLCVRPMRGSVAGGRGERVSTASQLAELRAELDGLRQQRVGKEDAHNR